MSLLRALTKKSRLDAAIKTVAQARKSEGGKQEQLFLKAYGEFQDVVTEDLVLAQALYNWGFALLQEARLSTGDAAAKLYQEARDKFTFCLIVDPYYLGAAIDGGVALMELARSRAVAINDPLYTLAKDHFERADSIHKGSSAYNLACVYALMGNDEACLAALQDAVKFGSLPNEAEILQDPDLESVKSKGWFTDFIASLAKPAEPEAEAATPEQPKAEDPKAEEPAAEAAVAEAPAVTAEVAAAEVTTTEVASSLEEKP